MDSLGISVADLNTWLGVLGILLFGYLLLMGVARRTARRKWFEWAIQRRKLEGKPITTLSSRINIAEFPWNDASLIEGGFTALIHVALLALYVPITLFLGYNFLGYQFTVIRNTAALLSVVVVFIVFLTFDRVSSYSHQYALPKKSFLVLKMGMAT